MQIRILKPADAETYQALRLQALTREPVAFASSAEEESVLPLAKVSARLKATDDRAVCGAYDGERLVGICGWARKLRVKTRHKGQVWGLYVDPEYRGQGIARKLLEKVLSVARRAPKLSQMQLTVYAGNPAAQQLYESLGFTEYGREKDAICIDGVFYEDLHMALYWTEEVAPGASQAPAAKTAGPAAKRRPAASGTVVAGVQPRKPKRPA
jgi:ribosomal protein S18 acetylase RimI-like enzyme